MAFVQQWTEGGWICYKLMREMGLLGLGLCGGILKSAEERR